MSGSFPELPIHYVIDEKRRLVISTGRDRVTFAETKAHQDQLITDPDFRPEFNQLIDATAVTHLDLLVAEAKTLASRKFFSAASRRAFVASSPAIFGMGQLMGAYSQMEPGREQVCIFYSLDAALEWLGVSTP